MTIVVDANVAIKWFIEQPGTDDAQRVQQYKGPLIAPALLLSETTSGLWRHVTRGDIDVSEAKTAVVNLPRWFSELAEDRLLAPVALDLAVELNNSPYDCFYLALAIERGAPLVTADKRFINRLSQTAYTSLVIHLPDWK
jgi:predicted nucleic acid-binding protein